MEKSDENAQDVENSKPSLAEIHATRARKEIATHWLNQRMPTTIEKPVLGKKESLKLK